MRYRTTPALVEAVRARRLNSPGAAKLRTILRVDRRWPEHRLTVELDSHTYHRSRHAWAQDRRREREARAPGDELRRYTWGDVFEAPSLMKAELCSLLPRARS